MATSPAQNPSSPLDSPNRPVSARISADPVAMAKLANLYHWADVPEHNAGNCPGEYACGSATTLDHDGLKAVVDAVQSHINHRVLQGLNTLRREVRESLGQQP